MNSPRDTSTWPRCSTDIHLLGYIFTMSELFYWFSPSSGFHFHDVRLFCWFSPSCGFHFQEVRACVRASVRASVLHFARFYFTQREQCGGSWWLIATVGDQFIFFQGCSLVALCMCQKRRGYRWTTVGWAIAIRLLYCHRDQYFFSRVSHESPCAQKQGEQIMY